jgi:prolipoprotein diacylglyceryltransferase
MQFPAYIPLGPFRVHPHWVFEALAYFVSFRVYLRLRKRSGDPIADPARWWVIAAAAAGAAIGSKVLCWFEDPAQTWAHLRDPIYWMAGKTIVGGLIGGLIAVEWTKWRLGIQRRTGDLFAIPLCVGIAIGRIGCFLTGPADHTSGIGTALPWGVDFGDGVARHPMQLYEVLFALALGVMLWRWSRRPHIEGDLFKGFMVGYMAFRFLVDFLKPDVRVALGLSSIQWACVAMLAYYARDVLRWCGVDMHSPAESARLQE